MSLSRRSNVFIILDRCSGTKSLIVLLTVYFTPFRTSLFLCSSLSIRLIGRPSVSKQTFPLQKDFPLSTISFCLIFSPSCPGDQCYETNFAIATTGVKLCQDFDAQFDVQSVSFQVYTFAPASKDQVIFNLMVQICRSVLILCQKSCIKILA